MKSQPRKWYTSFLLNSITKNSITLNLKGNWQPYALLQNINVNMPLSLTSHRTKSNDQIQVLICFEYSAVCDTVDQYFHPEAFNSAYTPSFPSSLLLVFPSLLVGSSSSFLYWQRSILGHFLLAGYTYSLVDLTHGHGLKKHL